LRPIHTSWEAGTHAGDDEDGNVSHLPRFRSVTASEPLEALLLSSFHAYPVLTQTETDMMDQQLVARIKRRSKYRGQTAPNQWFDVRVVEDPPQR
jgi:hypothetical protein